MSVQEIVETLEAIDEHKATNKLSQYKPYDFQKAFHHAREGQVYTSGNYEVKEGALAEERALICGNQIGKCCTFSTVIETTKGKEKIGDIFGTECEVLTYPDKEPRKVLRWVRKPKEECFRITMSDGQWVEVPLHHRILMLYGYDTVANILERLPESVFCPLESTSGISRLIRALDVLRYYRKLRDYLDDCSVDRSLCDEQLLFDQDNVQVFAPLQADARQHNGLESGLDDLVNKCTYSHLPFFYRLSSLGVYLRNAGRYAVSLYRTLYNTYESCLENNQIPCRQYSVESCQPQSFSEERLHQYQSFSSISPLTVDGNHIVSVDSVGVKTLYDMEVEERHNYIAGGLVHHNTLSAAMETAMHTTGWYPEWWDGIRFDVPVTIICCGKRNETVRDVIQNELLGDPFDESAFGTGTLPKDLIGKTTRKAGVPMALTAVMVRHVTGRWSKIRFMAFEQGPDAFMGLRYDGAWPDEEPPSDIMSQLKRSQLSKKKKTIYSTFTPEDGVTNVVDQLLNDMKPYQAVIRATWDDAPHFDDPEVREKELSKFPLHEREMRSKGIPLMGSGLIWPVTDESISVDPFNLPAHWPKICGVDFGLDHPFAAVWLAWDRDTDTTYIYDCYRESGVRPPIHAAAIKKRQDWIPIAWPHDGLNRDKGSGVPLAKLYRDPSPDGQDLNLLQEKFSNPPGPGVKEHCGGNGVEVGLFDIHNSMELGTFKVFSNLSLWFEEKNQYHRKIVNGKPVIQNLREDIMSATRYAYQSRRFAYTKPVMRKQIQHAAGASNW